MKKILCLLLVLTMIVPFAVACGDDTSSSSKNPTSQTSSNNNPTTPKGTDANPSGTQSGTNPTAPVTKSTKEAIPAELDMKGQEFYVLCRWFGYGKEEIDFTGEIIYPEPEEGETLSGVNIKKKEIIEDLQSRYNCKITGSLFCEGQGAEIPSKMREAVNNDMKTGTYKYDMIFESYYYYATMTTEGSFYDLNKFKYLDLAKDCWDQNAVENLSLCNKLFFGIGDINTYDNDGTFVMLYNDTLYNEEGFTENLYEIVEAKEWTFDKFKSIAELATKDLNGDNTLDETDQWGFGTEKANLYLHCVAAGEKICEKDSDDLPVLNLMSERNINALLDAVTWYIDSGKILIANSDVNVAKFPDNPFIATVIKSFIDGRELFYMSSLAQLPYFRNMKDEFGILPVPKFTKEQENYISSVQVHMVSCLMVPNSKDNVTGEAGDNLGLIIQALAEESQKKLTPEYYEKQLKYTDTRNKESADMLDLIFANRTYDLGTVFGQQWNDTYNLYATLDKNVRSRFEQNEAIIQSYIDDTITYLKELKD